MLTLTTLGIIALALFAHFGGANPKIDDGALARAFRSRWIVAAIFLVTFVLLWYSWAAWNPFPVVHDGRGER